MTPAEWEDGTAGAELVRLWHEYADRLKQFEAGLGKDVVERFTSDVIHPFQSAVQQQQMKAVAGWLRWRPGALIKSRMPTHEEQVALRDRLNTALESSFRSGWFGHRSLDSFSIELLKECRDYFDRMVRMQETFGSAGFAYLSPLEKKINGLVATAPRHWPPGAALHAGRLRRHLSGEPIAWNSLHDLTSRLINHAFHQSEAASGLAMEATEKYAALVQIVGPIAQMTPAQAEKFNGMLDCLRGWGEGFGVEILPRDWSFATPPTLDALRAEGIEIAAVYRPDEPAGTLVRLKTLGIIYNGELIHPAVVTVSAGQAPAGFAELEELVANADDPASQHLRESLHRWRDASLDGSIESVAVALFVEFWDRRRAELDSALATAFADRLANVLRDAFGLSPFFPANFNDHPPGWVEPADGGRMTTGRVREVLRPGLTDRGGELRVPARAVVE